MYIIYETNAFAIQHQRISLDGFYRSPFPLSRNFMILEKRRQGKKGNFFEEQDESKPTMSIFRRFYPWFYATLGPLRT